MSHVSYRIAFLTAALVACLTVNAGAQQWGNLKGKFVYEGTPPKPAKLNITKDPEVCGKHDLVDEALLVGPNGGLKNAVVYVRSSKTLKVNPEYDKDKAAEIVLDNKNCRFEPHVLPIQLTQTLVIKNSDPNISHNSNVSPLGDAATNPLIPAAGEAKHSFKRAQTIPQPVSCNIHPWMKGYVVPRDNPYTAVSAADGTFEIKNLPVGKVDFQAWQEKSGYLDTKAWPKGRFTYDIKPGDNDLGTIKLPASLFNK
ncbi:MAG: hypothetical protein HYX69_09195 [Planctomycetia bacterium]|nr:hypothetical protein [Planctomycetia bacterium]